MNRAKGKRNGPDTFSWFFMYQALCYFIHSLQEVQEERYYYSIIIGNQSQIRSQGHNNWQIRNSHPGISVFHEQHSSGYVAKGKKPQTLWIQYPRCLITDLKPINIKTLKLTVSLFFPPQIFPRINFFFTLFILYKVELRDHF